MADIVVVAAVPTTKVAVVPSKRISMKTGAITSHTNNNHSTTKVRSKAIMTQQQKFIKHNRFSETEKELLYGMFRQYKTIIDIKLRKSSFSTKQSEVRSCWETILRRFNEHPQTRQRTMRQIQKFWLNSKLRNRIPDIDEPIKQELPLPPLIRCIKKDAIDPKSSGYSSKIELSCHSIDSHTENEQHIEHIIEYITSDPHDSEMPAPEQEPNDTMTSIQQTMATHFNTSQNNLNHSTMSQASVTSSFGQRSGRRLFCGSDCGGNDAEDDHLLNHRNAIMNDDDDEEPSANDPRDDDEEEDDVNAVHAGDHNGVEDDMDIAENPVTIAGTGRSERKYFGKSAPPFDGTHERQMNQLRQQEQEFRVKEAQLRCELQQISVTRAQEELQQSREIHVLRISEMQIKLNSMKSELRTNYRGTGAARTTLL